MSQSINSVLVIGASGDFGNRLTRAYLRNSKIKTHILVRKGREERVKELTNLGAVPIEGDLSVLSLDELTILLEGIDVVVCALFGLAGDFTIFEGQLKLLKAAQKAKVKKFIPAMFGFNYDLLDEGDSVIVDEKKKILKELRLQKEVDYLIINTGLFYNFALDPNFLFEREGNKVKYYGSEHALVHATAPDDIAAYTAVVSLDPSLRNGVLNIVGDLKSIGELGRLIFGDNIELKQLGTADEFRKPLDEKIKNSKDSDLGNVLVAQFAWIAISGKALPSHFEDLKSTIGKSPISLQDYVNSK